MGKRLHFMTGLIAPLQMEPGSQVRLSRESVGDLRVGAGDLLPVAGHQPQLLPGAEREAPLAVELALKEPGRQRQRTLPGCVI